MARKKQEVEDGAPIIIKKYANRRLYNTQSSKYITLDFLAELTRKNVDFQVVDAKTGEDITHSVLTQIIMEEENSGENMLPVPFLKELISLYGDKMQSMVPDYLEEAMSNFRSNRDKFEDAVEKAVESGPFGEIAAKNIRMARQARDAIVDKVHGFSNPRDEEPEEEPVEEIDDIKKQMAELQAKLDKLSK